MRALALRLEGGGINSSHREPPLERETLCYWSSLLIPQEFSAPATTFAVCWWESLPQLMVHTPSFWSAGYVQNSARKGLYFFMCARMETGCFYVPQLNMSVSENISCWVFSPGTFNNWNLSASHIFAYFIIISPVPHYFIVLLLHGHYWTLMELLRLLINP